MFASNEADSIEGHKYLKPLRRTSARSLNVSVGGVMRENGDRDRNIEKDRDEK